MTSLQEHFENHYTFMVSTRSDKEPKVGITMGMFFPKKTYDLLKEKHNFPEHTGRLPHITYDEWERIKNLIDEYEENT